MEGITEIFFENTRKYPEKCAIWCEKRKITYIELKEKVLNYAMLFCENGICYGDHIGIPMTNSIESVGIMLTAALLGCVIVPINPTLPKEAVENAFQLGEVKHLIARQSFLQKYKEWGLNNVSGTVVCMDGEYEGAIYLEAHIKNREMQLPRVKKNGNELFIITMTSGSTGNPKPIALTQKNKLDRAWRHIELYHLNKDDRILAATPLYHSLAERLVLMPLMLGATSVLLPRFTPNLWLKCVCEQKVTFTIAVSAQLAQIVELLEKPSTPEIDCLRCVVSSSALLEPQIKLRLLDKFSCDFHEMYGTSETSTVTDIGLKDAVRKKESVGKPLPGVEIRIMHDDGTQCEIGEVGEILCSSDLICEGYYGMNEKFQAALNHNFFETGDLGYVDEEGYLFFVGRKKEIIITGGINVYPVDVEKCISEINDVQECAAFSYPDRHLGEVVAVAIVKRINSKLDTRTVQVQCAKNLADFQQPHRIFFVEELPKNSMGKIVKGKILEIIREREND